SRGNPAANASQDPGPGKSQDQPPPASAEQPPSSQPLEHRIGQLEANIDRLVLQVGTLTEVMEEMRRTMRAGIVSMEETRSAMQSVQDVRAGVASIQGALALRFTQTFNIDPRFLLPHHHRYHPPSLSIMSGGNNFTEFEMRALACAAEIQFRLKNWSAQIAEEADTEAALRAELVIAQQNYHEAGAVQSEVRMHPILYNAAVEFADNLEPKLGNIKSEAPAGKSPGLLPAGMDLTQYRRTPAATQPPLPTPPQPPVPTATPPMPMPMQPPVPNVAPSVQQLPAAAKPPVGAEGAAGKKRKANDADETLRLHTKPRKGNAPADNSKHRVKKAKVKSAEMVESERESDGGQGVKATAERKTGRGKAGGKGKGKKKSAEMVESEPDEGGTQNAGSKSKGKQKPAEAAESGAEGSPKGRKATAVCARRTGARIVRTENAPSTGKPAEGNTAGSIADVNAERSRTPTTPASAPNTAGPPTPEAPGNHLHSRPGFVLRPWTSAAGQMPRAQSELPITTGAGDWSTLARRPSATPSISAGAGSLDFNDFARQLKEIRELAAGERADQKQKFEELIANVNALFKEAQDLRLQRETFFQAEIDYLKAEVAKLGSRHWQVGDQPSLGEDLEGFFTTN
ncbi:hypothetical protein FA95DRAFT_1578786, partial [Auriscalpium vulgare]